jgi:hypothetical protein
MLCSTMGARCGRSHRLAEYLTVRCPVGRHLRPTGRGEVTSIPSTRTHIVIGRYHDTASAEADWSALLEARPDLAEAALVAENERGGPTTHTVDYAGGRRAPLIDAVVHLMWPDLGRWSIPDNVMTKVEQAFQDIDLMNARPAAIILVLDRPPAQAILELLPRAAVRHVAPDAIEWGSEDAPASDQASVEPPGTGEPGHPGKPLPD